MNGPLLIERSRGIILVHGRDPTRMIQGMATADMAAVTADQGAYTAFLTAKGRMVADARVFLHDEPGLPGARPGPHEFLLDVAPDALEPLMAHIARFVPPLFARAEDVTGVWAVIGVYGPGASEVLATASVATSTPAARIVEPAPEEAVVELPAFDDAFAVRTRITGDDGWDVFAPEPRRDAVVKALLGAGARPGDPASLDALRVAAGRPRWGRELTEEVIPLEAGLLDRAISQTKGCYTGQEVIVRILHRGHVNRHLRRLVFEDEAPDVGTELFEPGSDRPRGVVTSAVQNDVGALGLGYVRREIEPPAELRVGGPDGPAVNVEALD
jgi:tRNA-modifying protein YgfZ